MPLQLPPFLPTDSMLGVLVILATTVNTSAKEYVEFDRDVAPILVRRCVECHQGDDPQGALDLTSAASVAIGGDQGPALVPGDPVQSRLVARVVAGEMPPAQNGRSQQLPQREIEVLQQWIAEGARWPASRVLDLFEQTTDVRAGRDWWSLLPVSRPTPPHVITGDRVSNPIDSFVLARLEQNDMALAPPADRRTLIRRIYFDLLGLPPTPERVEAFVVDDSPDSYERLVDELLASPHHGERWARYWLDVVRFAESCGYERDQMKPGIWKYRDWVIEALNNDMPYDQFVTEQLAGDEVPWRSEATVIATGMLRAGTWNDEPNDPADYLYERLEDVVHVTSSAFLGLTVKCARCHDHKFDPIKQTDYYALGSFFWPGYLGQANLGGPSSDQLGYDVFGWTDKGAQPEPIRLLIKGQRSRPGPIVAPRFLSATPALQRPVRPPPENSRTTHRRLQLADWITDCRNPLTARVFVNRLWQHHFGRPIVGSPNNFGFKSDPPTHPDLLDWLAAEFMDGQWRIKRMHRLILLSTVYQQASSHPQHDAYSNVDFANRLLWRQNRRRLDAEALRDAVLAVSGTLNWTMGGESFYPQLSGEALEGLSKKGEAWGESSLAARRRRSIYMVTRRSRLLPMMTTFDFCDTTLPCGKRDITTVAPQALALMNNHFFHQQSEELARRVASDAGAAPVHQVTRAWRLALGRAPTESELAAALTHLAEQRRHFADFAPQQAPELAEGPSQLALASLCHVLLAANEFIYVD